MSIFKIISVRRKKGFWTWCEKMLICRKMRGDIWRRNIVQGAEIIELYVWPNKSAIGWIFGPQTANLRESQVRISGLKWCGALTSSYEGSNSDGKESPKR